MVIRIAGYGLAVSLEPLRKWESSLVIFLLHLLKNQGLFQASSHSMDPLQDAWAEDLLLHAQG